jgi:alkanesulfonate monooxygenase SsuD/methylene tetrahydromethanopterin reductase-like flavin-dependent oxidoreductase (luciferase family)
MRFGVHVLHFGNVGTTGNIRRIAEAAEAMDFDSSWVSDHVVTPRWGWDISSARNARSGGHE